MIGARIDLTERQRQEAAARRIAERLESSTAASQVGVWFCDLPFSELVWDQQVKEHFWLPPDARVTIDTFYDRIHPDDRERTRTSIEASIANRSRYDIDYRTVAPDGREKWIHAIGHAHYDAAGAPMRFDGVTIDISAHRSAEARNRFLLSLDDALRPLADPHEIAQTAARMLGEHLQADRCAYADIETDEDTMNLTGNYLRAPEIRSMVGRLKFSDFGPELVQHMRQGRNYVLNDTTVPGAQVSDPGAFAAHQIRAAIGVPLFKAGRLVAAMALHMATPRHWTANEVELVSAVAARCWESIERGRLERGLRESEAKFRAFVMTSSDVVYRMSADWSQMYHLEGRDFIEDTSSPQGGWLAKYIHPDDQARVTAAIAEAIRTKDTFQLEHRVIRVDGSLGWTFSRAIPLLDARGEIVEWFGTASDVTERHRAEEALRASEERYRSLFNSIDEGFCVIELLYDGGGHPVDYRFLEVNPAFVGLTGLKDATGKSMLDFVPNLEPYWLARYDRVVSTGEPVRFEDEQKPLSRWYDVYAFRLGGEGSRKLAVLFNEITQRKRSEEALRESEERARAASLAKDAFLAQLSHELRTPLTPVLMSAASLRDDPTISPEGREAFAMIERNITLEARLIDDLLDLTRVTRGKLKLREETFNIHSLLRQALEIVHDELYEKQIILSVELTSRHPHFQGDQARLQQVFWNLLRNAVHFTPHGGHITITSRDGTDDSTGTGVPCMDIEVSDDGAGFDEEHAEHLFEPFYQGTGSGSAGLGLGLAISRAIVQLHQGTIHARSAGPGKGAGFLVKLPIKKGAPATPDPAAPAGPVGRRPTDRTLRLLVVEDHEPTLKVLNTLLTRSGHQVTAASTVAEGLRVARTGAFDAVVSDLGLPDGTGIELMEKLRAEHQLTGVALSGYGMEEDVRRSKAAGFAAHLVKPVNFEELRQALRKLVPAGGQG